MIIAPATDSLGILMPLHLKLEGGDMPLCEECSKTVSHSLIKDQWVELLVSSWMEATVDCQAFRLI